MSRQPAKVIIEPHRLDAASYQQVRLLGVNLNQMMHHCHALQVPPPEGLPELLEQIRDTLAAAMPPAPPRGPHRNGRKRAPP